MSVWAEVARNGSGHRSLLLRFSGETGSLRRDPSRTRVAGDGVTFSRCRTAKSVAGNGWTEVVAPEERREKGGPREGGRRKAKYVIWQLPNLPFNPPLILVNSN